MLKQSVCFLTAACLVLLTGCGRVPQPTAPPDASLGDGSSVTSTSFAESASEDKAKETLAHYELALATAQDALKGKTLALNERFCVPFENGYVVLGGTQQPITDHSKISSYYERLVLPEEIVGQSFAQLKIESAENPGLQLCAALPAGLALRQIAPVTLTASGLLEATARYGEAEHAAIVKVVANRVPYKPFLDGSLVEDTDAYQIFVSQVDAKTALVWEDDSFAYWVIVAEGSEQEQLHACQTLAAQIQSGIIKMSV